VIPSKVIHQEFDQYTNLVKLDKGRPRYSIKKGREMLNPIRRLSPVVLSAIMSIFASIFLFQNCSQSTFTPIENFSDSRTLAESNSDGSGIRILKHPKSVIAQFNQTIVMGIVIEGNHPEISFQWYKDGVRLESETTIELNIENVSFLDVGNYHVEGSIEGKVVFSSKIARIDIPSDSNFSAPFVNSGLGSAGVIAGNNHELEIFASGSMPLYFQWFKDGKIIKGQTQEKLYLDNVQVSDSGEYTCFVQNAHSGVMSAPLRVEVD
jgi:hypothetical protein